MSEKVSQHRQAYSYCATCPKACRFACPVSDATRTETQNTWAMMTQAHLLTTGVRSVDESTGKALYSCTGCMRCRTSCAHENEVGFALFSARSHALEHDVAPRGARSTVDTFQTWGNPFGKELNDHVARYPSDGPARYALFTGCSSLVKRPDLVEDAVEVGKALGAPFSVAKASARCCGYPLYAAGANDEFAEHARRFVATLDPYPELVVLDPGCAYTLKVVYPRFGVSVPGRVLTIYEVLAQRLDHAAPLPKLPDRVAYQDACHLGRGLGQYEEPRALLQASAEQVSEADETKEHAGCSGGGGLLPRTAPVTAVEIAKRQADRAAPDGETLITACPTSRRMFERSGRKAEDLLSFVRRWLEAGKGAQG